MRIIVYVYNKSTNAFTKKTKVELCSNAAYKLQKKETFLAHLTLIFHETYTSLAQSLDPVSCMIKTTLTQPSEDSNINIMKCHDMNTKVNQYICRFVI